MTGALLYVTTYPDPDIPVEQYHSWYDDEHLPARLTVPGISSALQYQTMDGKKFLAYYDMDSDEVLKSKEYAVLKETASDNERALIPKVNMDRRVYKLIYTVGKQSASPPKTLLAVEMTPYSTHEKEFTHWYNTCHITQMADIDGWCRSRRFELIEPTDSGICKYLALHEFDKTNALGADKAGTVKWRNEVIEIVAQRDRSLWEPYHPANQASGVHTVNHGGIQFNVKADGTPGSPVIALSNPLGQDLSVWDEVVRALESKYQIIRHDQRGHGRTSQPTRNTSFPQLTDDLVAILDYLKVPTLHALIGVSMGGVVALDFGLRYPHRVGMIIPCDCQSHTAPDFNKEVWDARIALVKEKGIGALADQTAARWFTGPWKENPANANTLKKVRDLFAKLPPNAFIAHARAMDHYDYLKRVKDLEVPCTLVCGAQDLPLEQMKELEKQIPHAQLKIIDNCGHLPMVEQPAAFVKILDDALKG